MMNGNALYDHTLAQGGKGSLPPSDDMTSSLPPKKNCPESAENMLFKLKTVKAEDKLEQKSKLSGTLIKSDAFFLLYFV